MVRRSALLQCVFFISCVLLVLGLADPALAQFGLNRSEIKAKNEELFTTIGRIQVENDWLRKKLNV